MSSADKVAKKTAARRNTDARKEQNRLASRNYRQKRKQKLALLDSFLSVDESAVLSFPSGLDAEASLPTTTATAHVASFAESSSRNAFTDLGDPSSSWIGNAPAEVDDPFTWSLGPSTAPLTDSQHGLDSLTWGPINGLPLLMDSSISTLPPQSSPFTQATTTGAQYFNPPNINHMPRASSPHTTTSASSHDDLMLAALSCARNLSRDQKLSLIQQLQEQVLGSHPSPPSPSSSSPSSSSTDDVEEIPRIPRLAPVRYNPLNPATIRLRCEALRYAQFIDRQASGQLSPANLARVYSVEAGYFAAVFANCYAVGMDDLVPILSEDGVSVFSINQDVGYTAAQVPAILPKFQGLSADLRPSELQLTTGHHPWVDVIPFPEFRERALRALACDPPLFDEDEMCHDLVNAQGLVCWGSQDNCRGMGAGVPWDRRSWEPKIWFLNKYSHLVGDWDGEMWTGARWWHQTRNERMAGVNQLIGRPRCQYPS